MYVFQTFRWQWRRQEKKAFQHATLLVALSKWTTCNPADNVSDRAPSLDSRRFLRKSRNADGRNSMNSPTHFGTSWRERWMRLASAMQGVRKTDRKTCFILEFWRIWKKRKFLCKTALHFEGSECISGTPGNFKYFLSSSVQSLIRQTVMLNQFITGVTRIQRKRSRKNWNYPKEKDKIYEMRKDRMSNILCLERNVAFIRSDEKVRTC